MRKSLAIFFSAVVFCMPFWPSFGQGSIWTIVHGLLLLKIAVMTYQTQLQAKSTVTDVRARACLSGLDHLLLDSGRPDKRIRFTDEADQTAIHILYIVYRIKIFGMENAP